VKIAETVKKTKISLEKGKRPIKKRYHLALFRGRFF
jgi:hypothetical protein